MTNGCLQVITCPHVWLPLIWNLNFSGKSPKIFDLSTDKAKRAAASILKHRQVWLQGLKPQNNSSASGFWPQCALSGCTIVHICTYQSPSGPDGQSGFPIGSQGLQAVLWHLSKAKRWKAAWLLSSSCKYPVTAPGSGPNRLCAFSLHSLCFIKINDKAAVYAKAYLCFAWSCIWKDMPRSCL